MSSICSPVRSGTGSLGSTLTTSAISSFYLRNKDVHEKRSGGNSNCFFHDLWHGDTHKCFGSRMRGVHDRVDNLFTYLFRSWKLGSLLLCINIVRHHGHWRTVTCQRSRSHRGHQTGSSDTSVTSTGAGVVWVTRAATLKSKKTHVCVEDEVMSVALLT